MPKSVEETFRLLTLGDDRLIASLSARPPDQQISSGIDPRTATLLRIAALVALDAPGSSYLREASAAMAAGATREDVLGVLIEVAPVTGSARVVSAAPKLALAVGYDVEAALEAYDAEAPPTVVSATGDDLVASLEGGGGSSRLT
jgi:alkylhydroperoxidase/carboxymuconolactone decarboxylase family protein YurZ